MNGLKTKKIIMECAEDCTANMDALVANLETQLGVKLHADQLGDVVHGDVSCGFNHITQKGIIIVRLHEEEETPKLLPEQFERATQKVKAKSKKLSLTALGTHEAHAAHFKPHGLLNQQVTAIPDIVKATVKTAKLKGK